MNYSKVIFNESDFTGFTTTRIDVKDVIRDIATQIDEKVILVMFLLLTFWSMKYFILPVFKDFITRDYPLFWDILKPIIIHFECFLETIGLCSIVFIIVLAYIQGNIGLNYIIWFITLIIFGILAQIYKRKTKNDSVL